MRKQLPDLHSLNYPDRCRFIRYLEWMTLKQVLAGLPMPVKHALLQFPLVWVFMLGLPPAPSLPPVILPLVWCASFCISLSILMILRGIHARKTSTL